MITASCNSTTKSAAPPHSEGAPGKSGGDADLKTLTITLTWSPNPEGNQRPPLLGVALSRGLGSGISVGFVTTKTFSYPKSFDEIKAEVGRAVYSEIYGQSR